MRVRLDNSRLRQLHRRKFQSSPHGTWPRCNADVSCGGLAARKCAMNYKSFSALTTLTLLLAPLGVSAHHSLAAEFRTDNPIEITGVITDMEWINPHSYLFLDVTDEAGDVVSWHLELLPTSMLRKAGLTKELMIGDGRPVTVRIHTARDGTATLGYILKITYADGHYYQLAAE